MHRGRAPWATASWLGHPLVRPERVARCVRTVEQRLKARIVDDVDVLPGLAHELFGEEELLAVAAPGIGQASPRPVGGFGRRVVG